MKHPKIVYSPFLLCLDIKDFKLKTVCKCSTGDCPRRHHFLCVKLGVLVLWVHWYFDLFHNPSVLNKDESKVQVIACPGY